MRSFKGKILTLAAATALMSLPSAPSKAYDAPNVSFYPVASWDTTVLPDANTDKKFCLLMNEYNNGFIMQFQGAAGEIQSMSLDVRQDAFEVGQSHAVTLTVPGQTSLQLPAKSFSKNVISLNMQGQEALFANLRRANALDLQIGDNAFRFFLTGFANSVPAFDRCFNPMQPQPEPEVMAEMKAPEASPEITEETIEIVEPTEAVMNISNAEPMREAPSALMQDMSEKAKDKYTEELSIILQEPKERVSVELQKALDKQEQDLMNDSDLNLKPEPGERYTETLAGQMGIPKEQKIAAPAPIPASEPALEAVSDISTSKDTQEEVVEEVIVADTPATDMPLKETTSEEIIWNGPAVSKEVDMADMASAKEMMLEETTPAIEEMPAAEALVEEEEEKSLIDDIASFIKGDKKEEAPLDVPVSAAEPEEVPVEIVTPDPVVHSHTTPEPKVTKQVFKGNADFSDLAEKDIEPVQANAPFSQSRPDPEMAKSMERLKQRMIKLERENKALNTELEKALRASAQERLEISSDNWNLEEATMRFNESERQIAKLGQQIQKERAQCAYEKKELEMMLFDPQVTEEAQLARLASLEKKIEKLETELELQQDDYERQIKALKSRSSQ